MRHPSSDTGAQLLYVASINSRSYLWVGPAPSTLFIYILFNKANYSLYNYILNNIRVHRRCSENRYKYMFFICSLWLTCRGCRKLSKIYKQKIINKYIINKCLKKCIIIYQKTCIYYLFIIMVMMRKLRNIR